MVIFLTGIQPFPDGFGGSVYFCWPKMQTSWHLLGYISNQKPSAIFKIAKVCFVATICVLAHFGMLYAHSHWEDDAPGGMSLTFARHG